jgi:hypothetical protein
LFLPLFAFERETILTEGDVSLVLMIDKENPVKAAYVTDYKAATERGYVTVALWWGIQPSA